MLEDKVKVGNKMPRFWPEPGTQAEYGPAFIVQRLVLKASSKCLLD